jgi:hypothetical protein
MSIVVFFFFHVPLTGLQTEPPNRILMLDGSYDVFSRLKVPFGVTSISDPNCGRGSPKATFFNSFLRLRDPRAKTEEQTDFRNEGLK